jgi:hypothetical protein
LLNKPYPHEESNIKWDIFGWFREISEE